MSTTLTAWKFQRAHTADSAARTLRELARESLVVIYDAAIVEWKKGATRPTASQLYPITDVRAPRTTYFWGRLFGLLFFVPPRDEVNRTLSRALTDQGINDRFIARVQEGVRPGTSALFVVAPPAAVRKIRDAFGQDAPELTFTNLRPGPGVSESVSHER
jgi:uncharacterized membrane protein